MKLRIKISKIKLILQINIYCTSDVNFLTYDLSLNVIESTITQFTPGLSWSISGSTTIIYGITNYMSSTAPTWVTINPSTGVLDIISPAVTIDTEHYFYINSAISGVSAPVQKLIRITVLNWTPSYWHTCSNTSSSIWSVWSAGYTLNSGICTAPPIPSTVPKPSTSSSNTKNTVSETTKALSNVITYLFAATTCLVVFTSLANSSSVASLWMTINQLQIFENPKTQELHGIIC